VNESQRDGAEDGPLKGFEVLLQEFVEREEDENGEGEAGVSHGYVKGEPRLRVARRVDFFVGIRRRRWRRRWIGRGLSKGGGSEHVVPRRRGRGRVRIRVRDKVHEEWNRTQTQLQKQING